MRIASVGHRRIAAADRTRTGALALSAALLGAGCGGPTAVDPGMAAVAGEAGKDEASSPVPAGTAGCPGLDWRASLEAARVERRDGRLAAARARLLCATTLQPFDEEAWSELGDVEGELYVRWVDEASDLIERGRLQKALPILADAARLTEVADGGSGATRILARHGYVAYGREWLPEDDVVVREKREARLAEARRAELGCDGGFVLHRKRSIRIFTDHSTGEFGEIALRLQRMLEVLEYVYRDLFLVLDLPGSAGPGGLDLVVFRERGDYERMTGSRDTAGMFLPRHAASFFFVGEKSFEDIVPVVLHETCHQLDAKVLGLTYPPPWLQEGLAVFLEGCRVGPGGEIEHVGDLRAADAARVREALGSGGDAWWGARDLVATTSLEGIHGTDRVHGFYSQAGSLVKFLLEDDVFGRMLFYQLVEKARAPGSRPERAWRDFEEGLAARGETVPEFEARWKAASSEL